jgi:hypothetical protein
MPRKQNSEQKETVGRVMHEYKQGELKTRGSGPKVRSPKQAIAIALHEAGESRDQGPTQQRKTLRRTKSKERHGETALAEKEGRKAQSRVMKRGSAQGRGRASGDGRSKSDLYAEAKRRGIQGRSRMSKPELERALAH